MTRPPSKRRSPRNPVTRFDPTPASTSGRPPTARRHRPRLAIATGLVLALALLGGCDALDSAIGDAPATDALAPSEAAQAVARARAAENGDRAPDMESIGGSEAMRIYYQFVDDGGRVHFVERLAEVPRAWRDRVGFVEMDRPPPLTPEEARSTWSLSDSETTRVLAANPPANRSAGPGGRQVSRVVLYSAVWCGYCTKARKHLDREGVDYELRDVDVPAVAAELRQKTGRGGVPVLDYDGRVLRGYRAQNYDRAIDEIRGT